MGITKIEIEKPLKVKKRRKFSLGLRGNKYLYLVGGILLTILIVGLAYFAIIPGITIKNAMNELVGVGVQLQADLDAKRVTDFSTYLGRIDEQLNIVNAEIDKFDFLRDIPSTEGYYKNLQVIKQISSKSNSLLAEVSPDLDTIFESAGYKSGDTTESESGNEVGGIISELPRIVTLYQDKEEEILDLLSTFNKIDPNYIPDVVTGGIKTKVIQIQKVTADFPVLSAQLKDTLSMLPELLGAESPTKYLVIYQNEKEMRSSGGLLTAFGNLTIDKGVPGDDISSTDMLLLENYVSGYLGIDVGYRNIYGQDVLMNSYGNSCGSSYLRAQDSGIYPDLNVSIDMFKDYYDKANKYNKKQFPDYDHIVIINTFFASDIISLVEPLEVEGQTITSENAAKIIFGETSSQSISDPATRKEFIGKVASALKDKFNQLTAADFPHIVQILIKTIQAKNLAFYSENKEAQAYFDELGLSGRIEKNFAGDYFHLNEAQNCALKANFYVYDTVTKNITINEAGDIRKDISIEWVNEKVWDAAEENIYSASFNFRYRAWIRLFMPQGSKVVKTDGYEKSLWLYWPVQYFDKKMQKEVSDNIIYFDHRRLFPTDPVRKYNLNVSYTLPESLRYSETSGYRLLLQKHPGKKAERYIININDKGSLTTADFVLDRDKVLTYQNGIISVTNFDTRLDQYYDLMEAMK